MSKKWFVSRGDNTRGPLTSDEVKQMALTGILHVSDMVRPAESSDWRQAGTIAGLFSAELSEARTPPPLPQLNPETSVHPSSPTNSPEVSKLHQSTAKAAETMQTGLADIMSTAKQAKELASAHVRKTQITQLILPKAYLTLGKDVFSSERFQDELSVLFQRITATNDEIAKVKASTKERPQATDIKGKLQTGAASLLAQGQAAKLGLQRDSQFRALGKKSFELHGTESGTSDVVSPITTALDELQKIDARIAESSSGEKVPLWQRLPIAAFLTLCCFPVGLYLLWYNPRISRRTKLVWGGGFAAFLIFAMIIGQMMAAKAREELAAANQLWSSGDQQAAIFKYRTLVNDNLSMIPDSDRSLVLGRVIDFDAESGNSSSVEELLKLAEDKHIVPSVSSEKARSLQEKWLAVSRKAQESEAATGTVRDATTQKVGASSLGPSDSRQQLTAMASGEFNRLLAAIEAQDAEKIAELLKQADGYSLFTRSEIAALSRPQPQSGRKKKDPPSSNVTCYRDSRKGDDSRIDWADFCTKGNKNQYKTIQFDWYGKTPNTIEKIVFHNNGIDTAISIDSQGNRVTYVHCDKPGVTRLEMVPDTRRVWNTTRNMYEMQEFIRHETYTPPSGKLYQIIFDKDEGRVRINRGNWD